MPQGRSGMRPDSHESLFIDAGAVVINYGLPGERFLGATRGGNAFDLGRTIRQIPVDGALGPVKGFNRREQVSPVITCNMLEMTLQNLIDAIAGAVNADTPATVAVLAEYLGAANGALTVFNLDNSPVVEGSERVYLDGVLQERGADYNINYATGAITFTAAPAAGPVTAAYTYETGDPATSDTITGDQILQTSYLDNVALIGDLMGPQQQGGDPIVAMVKNALVANSLNFSTAERDEAVPQVQFRGHFPPDDAYNEAAVWEIRRPR